MEIPQSSTLRFSEALWSDKEKTQPINVADYDNIIMEVYTNANFRTKYSKVAKPGYNSFATLTGNIFTLVVLSEDTAKMNGKLYYDLKLIDNLATPIERVVQKTVDTGIVITNFASKNDK